MYVVFKTYWGAPMTSKFYDFSSSSLRKEGDYNYRTLKTDRETR